MFLILLATAPLLAQSSDDSMGDVGFEGLTSTYSVTTASDTLRTPSTLDLAKLEGKFSKADKVIEELLKQFEIILTQSETDEGDCYRTWETSRYTKMKSAGAAIERQIKNLAEKIEAITTIFNIAEEETLPQDVYISLMEKYGHMIHLITYHNIFREWGVGRQLRFETAQPFNEKWCHIVEEGRAIDFPEVFKPALQRTESLSVVSETEDSRGNALVREQNAMSQNTTIVSMPLSAEVLDDLIAQTAELIDQCQASREQLQANSTEEDRDSIRGYHFDSLEYRGSIDVFENDVKPHCADFIFNMIKLKVLHNEILSRVNLSKNFVTSLNTRSDWQVAEKNFEELCEWGSAWIACFDPWNKLERKYRLLPFDNFLRTFSFLSNSVATGAADTVTTRTGGGVSTQDVIDMLRTMHNSDRFPATRGYLSKIDDLTMSNAVKLSEYLYMDDRPYFMKIAKPYIK